MPATTQSQAKPFPREALERRLQGMRSACGRKTSYPTEFRARLTGSRACAADRPDAPKRLWVYACCACKGWHLTRSWNRYPAATATQRYEGVPH